MNEEIKEKKSIKKKNPKDEQILKLAEENALLNDKVLRLSAEMQNMNRRFSEEKANLCKYDGEAVIQKILPIVDNFERAIKLDDNDLTDELSKFLAGFKMIYTTLINTLEALEVKEINALNAEFDPNIMEAILTEHVDGVNPGIVLEVFQKGYIYKDKLIRAAMVKVNQ